MHLCYPQGWGYATGFSVERLRQHQLPHAPHVRQPGPQRQKVVTKPVNTAQPGPQRQKVVTKLVVTAQPTQQEVVNKSAYTAQPIQHVPGTQQPEHHEQVMVEDGIASQDQVQLRMGNNKFLSSPSDVPNPAQKEVVVKPVESAYGMEDDVPDLA